MRIIDCYYIRTKNNKTKTIKIHGVGIAYNVTKNLLYYRVVSSIATALAVNPIVLVLALSLGTGFIKGGVNNEKNKDTTKK